GPTLVTAPRCRGRRFRPRAPQRDQGMDQIVREIHAAVSVLRSRLGARTITRGGVVPLIAEGTHAGVRGRRAGPSFSELGSAHGIRYPRERVDAALPVVL